MKAEMKNPDHQNNNIGINNSDRDTRENGIPPNLDSFIKDNLQQTAKRKVICYYFPTFLSIRGQIAL